MRNVRVCLSYDGSKFFGWQRQAGFLSVQEALEDALESLVGERITVHGSGRTDTGVHALGQTASFHVDTRIDDERLLYALNAHVVDGITLHELSTCSDGFHARKSACGKRYLYVIWSSRFRPPFGRDYVHWTSASLDLKAMRAAAAHLVGEHDYSAFASAGSPRASNVRHVKSLHLVRRRDATTLAIQGNGFLYNMVRAIAGTLLEVGKGKLDPNRIPAILASRDRSQAGPTAPAGGLYLLRVLYPVESAFERSGGSTAGRAAGSAATP